MRGLAFSTLNPTGIAALTVAAMAVAFGIAVTRPDIVLGVSFGVALLAIAFLSTEVGLYILIFSMLLSPEIIVGQLGGQAALGRGITLRLDDSLLLIIGLGWLARTAIYKQLGLFRKTPLNRPILFYILACIFSTLVGVLSGRVNPTTGFFFVLKYFEFFFVYFMVVNTITDKAQIKRLLVMALTTCFLISFYAIAQIPGGGRVTAPFEGGAGEPNTLGGYLVFMLSIVGGLFFNLQSRRGRILLAGLAGMIMIALLATQSRASYLAVLMVFGAFLTLSLLSRRHLWLFTTLAILLLLSPFILPSPVKQRVEFTFTQPRTTGQIEILGIRFDTSTSERIRSWQEALQDFKKHAVLGYGVTGYHFLDAQFPRVLVETGLIGLLAFLYLLYRLGQQGLSIYKTASDPYEKGLALGFWVGVLGLLVHAIGANTFIIVRIMEPFWLFAGLVMVIPKLEKRVVESNSVGVPR